MQFVMKNIIKMQRYKCFKDKSLSKLLCDSFVDGLDKIESVQVAVLRYVVSIVNTNCQVFCHFSILYTLNCSSF